MAFDHPFYFLRHGETTWNAERRCQGQFNSQLSDTGREQAETAADALKDQPIQRIVASPLDRAMHTAEAVARATGLEIETDPDLMECHLGEWQGQPHGAWLPAYFRGEQDPPGGETFDQFCDRVWGAMARAVARGPDTLIVAHGGLWIAARTRVTVAPNLDRMPNALPLRVDPRPGHWDHAICGGCTPSPAPIAY